MQAWEPIDGCLATPSGFRAAAVAAGIKKQEGALDLALIVSDAPQTTGAGVFTTNLAAAAPVVLCRKHLRSSGGLVRAIVANAGNANACTGRAGMRVAQATARAAAKLLGVPPDQTLVASTGVIGLPLKLDRILAQLPALNAALSPVNAAAVSRAIMTTDTFPKVSALRSQLTGKTVHVAGVAKGAGMIHPRLATMLCFLTTDAAVSPRHLQQMLRAAVDSSFNCLSVDGDTSTNDSVIALASGLSGARVRPASRTAGHFLAGLTKVCQALAQMIARDGEGARKLVTIEVHGARNEADARRIARAIANSPLVKTAIAGSDPNWGRIVCAAGYSGARFDPANVNVSANGLFLCRRGLDAGFDEAAARQALDQREVLLRIDLRQGRGFARFWTCDFTRDYIDINTSYRT